MKISTKLQKLNFSRKLCNHFIGEEHSIKYRCIVGTVIIFIGVGTAKAAEMIHFFPVHVGLDGLGYLIHGIGSIPFVEWISKIGD